MNVNDLGFCRSFFVGLLPISVSVPPLCNADGHHLRHYKLNQRMRHHSGCCVSVAGSVESLSHNSNPVGRGRRYRDHSVQMCIADLNPEMQGRYARHDGVVSSQRSGKFRRRAKKRTLNRGIKKLSSSVHRFEFVLAAMAQPSVASGQGGSHGPRTDGIPGYSPPTFHVTTNEAGCGDGHGNAIVLPEGVHSMEDKKGVLHFFDLSGDAWQDDETTAFDCRQGRPEVDDLLNGLFPYVTSHVYGSGSDKDSFIRCHPNYGTNEKHPSGVPPGKYQELMHSVLYKRALRQSQYAVIQTMRQQLEDYRRQVKNMRDEMVIKRDACRSLG